MNKNKIEFNRIKTIFIDAGNTLVSMDLAWFSQELKHFDIECSIDELSRAEASARPVVSSAIERFKSTENKDTAILYIDTILNGISSIKTLPAPQKAEITDYILNTVSGNGQNQKLWNNILTGVPEALDLLKNNNYSLSVVSNSNGTVEKILTNLGLDRYFDHIFDSHIIGFEKPDPRFFRHALKTCGAEPETTVHIGDMYHVDVLGAWNTEIGAVLLDPYNDWKDYECIKFPDLLSAAKEIVSGT